MMTPIERRIRPKFGYCIIACKNFMSSRYTMSSSSDMQWWQEIIACEIACVEFVWHHSI